MENRTSPHNNGSSHISAQTTKYWIGENIKLMSLRRTAQTWPHLFLFVPKRDEKTD